MAEPFLYKRGRLWWIGWWENGQERRESLKTPDAIKAEIKKGELIKRLNAEDAGVPNITALWDTAKSDFLAGYKDGTKTKKGHQRTITLFEKYAGPIKVSDITYKTAKGFRDHLQTALSKRGEPYAPASINIHIRNLHTFFNEAIRLKYVAENPFHDVKQIPDTKRKPRYLTKEEVGKLMAEAGKSWDDAKILMLHLFLYTGVRAGELVNLRWSSIDLTRKLFYLHGSESWDPKDREENVIGLHPELEKRLRKHPKTSDYVFPGMSGGRRDQDSLARLFNRLYRRAKITTSGLHILRHTFATHCGLSPKAKQKVMGHSDIRTTMRYDHVTPEDMAGMGRITYH
jgi:integrase